MLDTGTSTLAKLTQANKIKRSSICPVKLSVIMAIMKQTLKYLILQVDIVTTGRGSLGAFIALCFIIAALGGFEGVARGALLGDLVYMKPIYIQVPFRSLSRTPYFSVHAKSI